RVVVSILEVQFSRGAIRIMCICSEVEQVGAGSAERLMARPELVWCWPFHVGILVADFRQRESDRISLAVSARSCRETRRPEVRQRRDHVGWPPRRKRQHRSRIRKVRKRLVLVALSSERGQFSLAPNYALRARICRSSPGD